MCHLSTPLLKFHKIIQNLYIEVEHIYMQKERERANNKQINLGVNYINIITTANTNYYKFLWLNRKDR